MQTANATDPPVLVRYSLGVFGSDEMFLNEGWIRGSGAGGQRRPLHSFHDLPVTDEEIVELNARNDTGSSVTVEMRVIVE